MTLPAVTSPDAASVRDALRRLRHGGDLMVAPLLLCLTDTLLAGARRTQAEVDGADLHWRLGQLLSDRAAAALAAARTAAGQRGGGSTPMASWGLERDFSFDDATLEAWSALWHRYLAVPHRSVAALVASSATAYRTFNRRMAQGHSLLATDLHLAMRAARQADLDARTSAAPRVVGDGRGAMSATSAGTPALSQVLAAVRGGGQPGDLPAEILAAAARSPVRSVLDYLLARLARETEPQLGLRADLPQSELRLERDGTAATSPAPVFMGLAAALAATTDPILALLGPPGAGKTTMLRRQEQAGATAMLKGETDAVPAFISLAHYRPQPGQTPRDWLNRNIALRFPALGSFDRVAGDGPLHLLLDGLNEMPHRNAGELRSKVAEWRDLLWELARMDRGHRMVVSCRDLDYVAPLSLGELQVPLLHVGPLAPEAVRSFLESRLPASLAEPWLTLLMSPEGSTLRLPVYLMLLKGMGAEGRTGLFTGYLRHALRRESERGNPWLEDELLLTEHDRERCLTARAWRHPWELPEEGRLMAACSELALHLMGAGGPEASAELRLPYAEAIKVLDAVTGRRGKVALRAAEALGLLDEQRDRDDVGFRHQLLQEYMAGRTLAREPRRAALSAVWRADAPGPSLPELLDGLAPAERLPGLQPSGWEEALLMAAVMAEHPDGFVGDLATRDLVLAAQAAAQPELCRRLSGGVLEALRAQLGERQRDSEADLRARVAAGLAAGALEAASLRVNGQGHRPFTLPVMVDITDGSYPIGDDEPVRAYAQDWREHLPRHRVDLACFRIARGPVTNADWTLFMAAGGYEEDRWWDSAGARSWRRGEGTAQGNRAALRWWLQRYRQTPDSLADTVSAGVLDERQLERLHMLLSMDEAALTAWLDERFPDELLREPAWWQDANFNNPAQPVVGICWYEARAYCRWLSDVSGRGFRLPTEVQWEAAARGREGRRYAYGPTHRPLATNSAHLRLRAPSPPGCFPEGDTPSGLWDMSGNVFEWTSSLGRREDDPQHQYCYPYDAADGRENAEAPADVYRVVRGGAWNTVGEPAWAAVRGQYYADYRGAGVGLRVVDL